MASIYDDPRYAALSEDDKNILTKQQLQQQFLVPYKVVLLQQCNLKK